MAVFQNNLLMGAASQAGGGVHSIEQSIRFNDDDSPFMTRTPGSTGNRRTWSINCWVKLGNSPGDFTLWSVHTGYQSYAQIRSDGLEFAVGNGSSSNSYHKTNRVFRDGSAWYNFLFVFDSTNAQASERARIYVNGQRETSFSTTGSWALNYDSNVNFTQAHYIGEQGTGGNHLDGYLADFVIIDGLALDPSSFGETNDNGIWVPKDITGLTFGTNGVFIDGRDASDLGDDESGNGNDFTTSGLASHDQMADSPTNNFAVMNPLGTGNGSTISQATFSNGNLEVSRDSATIADPQATIVIPASFKCYFEVYNKDGGGSGDDGNRFSLLDENFLQTGTVTYFVNYYVSGKTKSTEQTESSPVTVVADGNIVSYAVDIAGGEVKVFIQGSLVKTFTIGSAYRSLNFFPASRLITLDSGFGNHIWNFGQEGTFAGNITAGGNSDSNGVGNFKYSVPSGFQALCTKNLGS